MPKKLTDQFEQPLGLIEVWFACILTCRPRQFLSCNSCCVAEIVFASLSCNICQNKFYICLIFNRNVFSTNFTALREGFCVKSV